MDWYRDSAKCNSAQQYYYEDDNRNWKEEFTLPEHLRWDKKAS